MTLRNKFLCNLNNAVLFCVSLLIFSTLMIDQNIFAQTKSEKKKNSEITDQEQKELDKAKKLRVRVRTKHVAFYTNSGELPAKRTLTEKIIFDKSGNKKEQILYTSLGQVQVRYTYKYDANGNLISSENINGTGAVVSRRTSKYDKNRNEVERIVLDNKHHDANKAYFTYDSSNNLLETKNYSGKDELLTDIILKYQNGLLIDAITKDGKGNIREEIKSSYDSLGRLVNEKRNAQGKDYDITYQYDKEGNLIETTNPQYKRFYTYNRNNDLIEDKMFLTNGPRQFKVRFTYLPNGLQKEEIRYDNADMPAFYSGYKYEYYK